MTEINGRGRPSKLTPEVTKRLVDAIAQGNYFDASCRYAGIDYSTFRKWMQKGEAAKNGKYRDFFEAIKRAEADAELRIVQAWQQHIPEDWKACATFLERRYPEKWARRERMEMKTDEEKPVCILSIKGASLDALQ